VPPDFRSIAWLSARSLIAMRTGRPARSRRAMQRSRTATGCRCPAS